MKDFSVYLEWICKSIVEEERYAGIVNTKTKSCAICMYCYKGNVFRFIPNVYFQFFPSREYVSVFRYTSRRMAQYTCKYCWNKTGTFYNCLQGTLLVRTRIVTFSEQFWYVLQLRS